MRYAWLGCLLLCRLLVAAPQDADVNVNARYTVESVILSGKGWTTNLRSETTDKISFGLRHQLVALIGQKLNPAGLDTLAANLKKELSAREVTHRVVRGQNPEEVRVEFEVKPAKVSADLNLDQFVYDSRQGWSGSGAAGLTAGQHSFSLGLVSDGDWLDERYAGFRARYDDKRLLSDRISFRFQVESYHDQWNTSTIAALASAGAEVPLGLLVAPARDTAVAVEEAVALGCSALHLFHLEISSRLVQRVHDTGMMVVAWTVNGSARVAAMLDAGVDAIVSDDVSGSLRAMGAARM
jgi:hypothetical protein